MVHCGNKWVINMFMGEYHHTIDEKGRIIIPSKIREELTDEFIVTRGIDNCLFIYRTEDFKELIRKYKELPNTKDARNFMRFFLSGALPSTVDKQGRLNISDNLIEYAHLKKECVIINGVECEPYITSDIIGVSDRLEIWSEELWNKFMTENEENMADIADKLFASNI